MILQQNITMVEVLARRLNIYSMGLEDVTKRDTSEYPCLSIKDPRP